ncbi:MAG: hypothetical protein Q9196_001129 [Gyalolechia fulgens]
MRPTSANIVFGVLGVAGFYNTWGRTFIDGTLVRLLTALHGGKPYFLSGTTERLKTNITGLYWPVDYLLNLLILFFWEAVDGSHPTTSLVAVYFAGQHLSMVVAQYVDSYRHGNAGRWKIGATLWLMLYQLTAIGTSGPWFLAAYFSISPLVDPDLPLARYRSLHLASPVHVLVLPISATLGYIIPLILMSWPSPTVDSSLSKQFIIALWNIFPLTMAAIQLVLSNVLAFSGVIEHPTRSSKSSAAADSLLAVRVCYAFALAISFMCHIGVVTLSLATVLFPMIFTPEYASAFSPHRLLMPPFSWSAVSTFGEGDLGFMQWDQILGYTCMLLFSCLTYQLAQDRLGVRRDWRLYGVMLGGCMMAGPGSTVLAIQWLKDELLFTGDVNGQAFEEKDHGST